MRERERERERDKYIYIIYLPASFHTRNMVSLTHPLSHSLCQGPKKCLARSLFLWLSVSVSVSSLLSRTHTHAPTLSLSVRGQNLCDSMRFWYALLGPDMLYSSLSLTLSGLEICATVCAAEFTTDFTLSLLLTLHCLYYCQGAKFVRLYAPAFSHYLTQRVGTKFDPAINFTIRFEVRHVCCINFTKKL